MAEETFMVRKSVDLRNAEQKERQRLLRERQKAERRPGCDDVARVALHWLISKAVNTGACIRIRPMYDG
ncbi:hypothetical protein [Neorhizobium galegae]|uniref:hypothetical protein n=1 Tax=Neorhizobium galegae TaxID=399 RepID=UPI001F15870E|nr:hypothetical protein [Neorhizobium galegae]UIK06596.1 hypothetical protein LZK81_06365 [Neorhizobium galegae]